MLIRSPCQRVSPAVVAKGAAMSPLAQTAVRGAIDVQSESST
jgi:hypothetical protein